MTELQTFLLAVRERLQRATPGPWTYVHGYGFNFHPSQDGPPTANTVLVCHAPQDLARLVRIVEVQAKALEDIQSTWDISNPSRVVPRHHAGELAPNDSLAAGAILGCTHALESANRIAADVGELGR